MIGKAGLESMARDPRFIKVKILIDSLPTAENAGELASLANIVVWRINRLFDTSEGGPRDHDSKTPATYGVAPDDLARTTPLSDTRTTNSDAHQSSDFGVHPTLFRGYDQRKWDKILTESSFSITHKATRSVLIAMEATADGVQSVRLRAVRGSLFLASNVGRCFVL